MRRLTHGLGITIATAGIVLATLLPFLPGSYDSLAVPLSLMCRTFGMVGPLLLVPVGAVWVASGYWSRLARRQYGIAIAALVALSLIWAAAVLLGALMTSGWLLALAGVAVWGWVVSTVLPRLRVLGGATPHRTSAIAFYVLVVPVAVAVTQSAALPRAIERSRNRAIRNSAGLIESLERYRTAHGRYPVSLLSLWQDQYKPGVVGIEKYQYEPHEDAYNLIFEQSALPFGTREFVVYNPRDRQVMTAHLTDLLELTPEQLVLERTRGHYAVHDAGHRHWKYFWFD